MYEAAIRFLQKTFPNKNWELNRNKGIAEYFEELLTDAYNEGYDDAKATDDDDDEGYDKGYSDGYDEGYDDAYKEIGE